MAIVGEFYHREGYTIPLQYIQSYFESSFDSSESLSFLSPIGHCLKVERKK